MSINAENSNVSIRVREEIYENQRWRFKPRGFGSILLPTDRFEHSNKDGTQNRDPKLIELPFNSWRWKGDWEMERTIKGRDLVEGWMYATDFPTTFSANKHWRHWVRRRKWYRIREISSFENNHNCTSNDWAVGINGHIYFRNNVIRAKPERDQPDSEWTSLGKARIASKLYYACQLAVSASGTPFIVTKTGGLLFRIGISSSNHFGTSWVSANCPPGGIYQVAVGKDALWAITSDLKCWTLNGKLGDILFPRDGDDGGVVSTNDKRTEFQFEWIEVPGRMQSVAVSKNDETILGTGTEKNVFYRTEVTQGHPSGRSWSEVLPLILNDESDGKWSIWCIPSLLTFSTQKYKEKETGSNSVELQILEKVNQSETELNSSNTATISQVQHLNAETNTNAVPDPDNNVPEFLSTGKSIDDLKFYHPLSQGFQPGSEILIEILIHTDAKQLEINFNGKESKSTTTTTMYQFKPKLDDKVVSRNSQHGQNGSWGVEETESKFPFPFKRGRSFTLSFVCEESQFYTVVKFNQRSNSAFSYTHRFPIEDIGHLAVMGDVDVIGVRCDSVNSIGGKCTEFLIYPEAYPLASANASVATFIDDIESEYLGHRATSSSFGIPSYYSELKRGSDLLMNCSGGEQRDSVCRQVIYLLLTRELRLQLEIEVAKLRSSGEDGPGPDPCKKSLLSFLANNETMKLLETGSDRPPGNIDLDKWLVYTQVQCEYPWRAKLLSAFPPLLTSILEFQKQDLLTAKNMRDLWIGADRLVDCFAGIIQTVHPELHALCENEYLNKICAILGQLKDLFSPVIGQYIVFKINRAVQRRAINSFNRITANHHSAMEQDDVEASAKIGRALIVEFKNGLELLDSSLKKSLGIDFFKSTYQIYDAKLADIVRPLARRNSLRPTSRESGYESGLDCNGHKDLSTNQMFRLYVVVKQFAEESSEISPSASKNLNISENYHLWFYFCVHQWLDITWNQVTNLIQKSIQHDTLCLDACADGAKVKFSSSAIDSAHIFHQIYSKFWRQLSWPQTEDEFAFITKIVDDIGRCIMYYAEVVCTTVDKINRTPPDNNASTSTFEISTEFCLAISNIEYLLDAIKPFASTLQIEKIFENFEARHGPAVAEQCRETVSAVMENATGIINKKIGDILDTVGPQMEPVISHLVGKVFSPEAGNPLLVPHPGSSAKRNALEIYLDSNLKRLVQTMPEKNLNKILNVIWEIVLVAVKKEIKGAVEKWKGPEYFQRISTIINFNQEFLGLVDPSSVLEKFGGGFAGPNSNAEVVIVINEIRDLLELHGSSTENLILKYTLERYKFQKQDGIENNGMVTFRAAYFEDIETLQIEILNCYKLKTTKKNGTDVLSDPYIKVEVVPLELYRQIPSKDTHVEKETDCPLFDVTFKTELTQDQMSQGGMISFSVYYVRPITPKFVGEAFIPLEKIPRLKSMSADTELTANQKFKDLPQQRIPLTKLKSYLAQVTQLNDPLTVILESLDHRPGAGKKFVRREKQKQHISSSSSRPENNTGNKNVELDTISTKSQVSTMSTSSSGSNLEKKKRGGFKILKVFKSKLKSS